ncbi:MAG TPA: hypothetical protein ENJ61_03820 [Aquifex aeolicus]|uniref:DUF47 family protein n=1 Tax=Aquifex aeolicus TaxID=63363 RepID=A0A7C5Q8E6_AQUAO|nr:hypothetical protein [Aquifex aeolicus]
MEVAPYYVLLAKLEEEISFQRKVVNTFLFLQQRIPPEATLKSMDVLRRLIQNLRLITLVLEELESMTDRYAREQALLLSSESLSLATLLLPAMEMASPLFLESIRVYEESILDRIESVVESIENSLQDYEELATDEVVQTVEDIVRTLEYHLRIGERTLGRIL